MKKLLSICLMLMIVGCSNNNMSVVSKEMYIPIKIKGENKIGFINLDGEVVIEPTLEGKNATMFDVFNNEYSIVVKDDNYDEWYLINSNGEIFLNDNKNSSEYRLKTYSVNKNGEVIVQDNSNELWKMNHLGEKYKTDYYNVNIVDNPKLSCNKSYIHDEMYYCLDEEDNVLFTSENSFSFPNQYYFANNNFEYNSSIGYEILKLGKGEQIDENSYYLLQNYRFIDKNGNKLFDGATFDDVTYFSNQGYASVKKDNKKWIINTEGKMIYTLNINEDFLSFSNKNKVLLKYEKDGKIGLKNIDGKTILSPKYTFISLLIETDNDSRYVVALKDEDSISFKIIDEDENEIAHLDELKVSLKEIKKDYESIDSYFSWNINSFSNHLIAQDRFIYDCNGKELIDLTDIDKNAYIIGPDPNLYYLYTDRHEK
ncbi:hypothetical protein F300043A5_14960 [Massilimicrobiota timonensis]|uniref:WG repeat-containing protein n=1 Tax=Massilimicrobiota timonensis TaxID=1776392 RepID=UPI0036F34DD4